MILDLFSPKVIGWAISKHIDGKLTLSALNRAIEARQPPPGCIHHSDRGVQYLCNDYIAQLRKHKLTYLDVLENLPTFIEEGYNEKRVRSGINYLTPSEFEERIKTDPSFTGHPRTKVSFYRPFMSHTVWGTYWNSLMH